MSTEEEFAELDTSEAECDTAMAEGEPVEVVGVAEIYADLVGIPEIAEGLGVGIHRVRRWIERRESTRCPSPVRALKAGHIYSLREWRGWYALWRITRGSETWFHHRNQ